MPATVVHGHCVPTFLEAAADGALAGKEGVRPRTVHHDRFELFALRIALLEQPPLEEPHSGYWPPADQGGVMPFILA